MLPHVLPSRLRLICACGGVSAIFLCALAFHDISDRPRLLVPSFPRTSEPIASCSANDGSFSDDAVDALHSSILNGPATSSFKDNLRNSSKYITSWGSSAGWTNDVISFMHLIYIGVISERVPVIPHFTSTHLPWEAQRELTFGDVFDIPSLEKTLRMPVIEWHEVKQSDSSIWDDVGCWNVWSTVANAKEARGSHVTHHLKLDISYTKTPEWIKMYPQPEVHDLHSTFWGLASLGFPTTRANNLGKPVPSSSHHVSLQPDEQLLCFDYLYYVGARRSYEFDFDYSPAWRFVGQHLRWTQPLEQLTDDHIRRTLGVKSTAPIPPFISVHVRRSDFQNNCPKQYTVEECFATLETFARRVDEVKAEVLKLKDIEVNHVIVTSDEQNQTWWGEVAERGFSYTNYTLLKTEEDYGVWYPVLIDAAIQSRGIGFVGTEGSTMSVLAARRVQSWHDGVVKFVKWGHPGADKH